jgi:CheY-like chemotaxis protein
LEENGYQATFVSDGQACVEAFKVDHATIDLVLMDCQVRFELVIFLCR